MAESQKNEKKRELNLKKFTSESQPPPEAKSEGWKKKRAEKLLTQEILKTMLDGENLKDYVASLVRNAKDGNAKAIETINKGIEDEVIKIANTDSEGQDVDYSRYTDEELRIIAALQSKGGVSPA